MTERASSAVRHVALDVEADLSRFLRLHFIIAIPLVSRRILARAIIRKRNRLFENCARLLADLARTPINPILSRRGSLSKQSLYRLHPFVASRLPV